VDAVAGARLVRRIESSRVILPGAELERAVTAVRTIFPVGLHENVLAVKRWIEKHYGPDQFVPLGEVFTPGSGVDLSDAARQHGTAIGQPRGEVDLHQFVGSAEKVDVQAAVAAAHQGSPSLPTRPLSLALLRYRTMHDSRQWVEFKVAAASMAILGRFSGLDDGLLQICREFVLRQEEIDDGAVIRAEVRGLYRGRAQNVAIRPTMRQFCIDLGSPTQGRDAFGRAVTSIPVSDLALRSRGRSVELYSRSLGRRILPSIENALRSQMAAYPILQFLHGLSAEAGGAVQWNWGTL
jgi:hypothetical protein